MRVPRFADGLRPARHASIMLAILFTILLAIAPLAGCTTTRIHGPTLADEIRAVERARLAAMVAADMPTLERLLAEDLQYGHSTGAVHSKRELLALLGNGALDYLVLQPHALDVRTYAGTSLVSGTLDVDATSGSRRLQTALRFLAVYAHRDGRWQLVGYQSAAIAK